MVVVEGSVCSSVAQEKVRGKDWNWMSYSESAISTVLPPLSSCLSVRLAFIIKPLSNTPPNETTLIPLVKTATAIKYNFYGEDCTSTTTTI